jgi:hypothetical protein
LTGNTWHQCLHLLQPLTYRFAASLLALPPTTLHHHPQTVEAKDAHIGELQERLRHVLDSGDVANADHESQINKLVISMTQMKEAYSSQVGA